MGTGRGWREKHIRIFPRAVMPPRRANTYGIAQISLCNIFLNDTLKDSFVGFFFFSFHLLILNTFKNLDG